MWNLIGQILDLVGVLILGWDVVRIQRGLLASARTNAGSLEKLEANYGGSASWLEDIKQSLKWVPGSSFQEHHAEDEVSYNARRTAELSKDTADAAAGVGEYVIALAVIARDRAKEDLKIADTSLRLSAFGLVVICIGFACQAHGSVIQMCDGIQGGVCSWLFWL